MNYLLSLSSPATVQLNLNMFLSNFGDKLSFFIWAEFGNGLLNRKGRKKRTKLSY